MEQYIQNDLSVLGKKILQSFFCFVFFFFGGGGGLAGAFYMFHFITIQKV